MLCALSKLDEEKIESIKSTEKQIGKTLLAFSCYEAPPETLSAEELAAVKEAERKLGVVLVAVKM
jgi:hypothetical protein